MEEGSLTTIDLGIDGVDDAVEIGRGGFGSVYRARQKALQRNVAIKVLRDAVEDPRVRSRFERECWAMGTLAGHPHIITVHGSGFTESGQPYIVMDYMPGGTLSDRLDQHGPLPWHDVLALGVKLAGALETAHRSGVLHRDIKPENVLMSKYHEPQLADFGIARLQGREETKTDTLTASIAHVSPELLAGDAPSVASDVYALGSTLFMLLKGRPAFIHDTDQSIVPALTRITSAPVPDLRDEGVPAQVCDVIERLMAKDPAQRDRTAEEAGRLMQMCQETLGQPVSPLTVIGEPRRAPSTEDHTTDATAPEVPGGHPRPEPATAPAAGSAPATPPVPDTARPPAADPAGPTQRRLLKPALAVVATVVVLAVATVGVVALLADDDPGQVADATPSADADTGTGTDTDTGTPAEPADEGPALLTAADLGEEWAEDAALAATTARPAPAYLCSEVTPPDPPTVEGAAFRAESTGARAAHTVRTYAAGGADAFMTELESQVSCLEGLPGLADVASEEVDAGDEALLVRYTRPGPERDLDIATGFVRNGDSVAQVLHLASPIDDEELVRQLLDLADEELAAGAAG